MDLSGLGCALTLVLAGADPTVTVRGDTDCPTASDVAAALVGLVAPPPPSEIPDVVELRAQGASVLVKLTNNAGPVAERGLPVALSCAERARAAAVIVAAWEVRLHAAARPTLPLPPAGTSSARTSSVVATPPPSLKGVPLPATTAGPLEVETGAAVLGSLADGALASAAWLEAVMTRRNGRFSAGVSGVVVGTHTTSVGEGKGAWRRWGAVIDLREISRWGRWELEMQAGVGLTALAISGRSLPRTASATVFDPGVVAGLRARWRPGRLSTWVQATATFWPRTHDLYVIGATSSVELSPFEALLGVGFSLGAER